MSIGIRVARGLGMLILRDMAKRPREPHELQEAKALSRLFKERAGCTQAEFGERWGIGGQAMVWQYMSGHTPLNLKVAIKFARGLHCTIQDFSPSLAAQVMEAASLIVSAPGTSHPMLPPVPKPVQLTHNRPITGNGNGKSDRDR